MHSAVIYDCEYLTVADSPSRYWCGPMDPDPTVVQIGAVRLSLVGEPGSGDGFALGGELEDELGAAATFEAIVRPRDRTGAFAPLDPHFTWLTGITPERVQSEGVPLTDALNRFGAFAGADRCWSWGKDELNLIAISCWVEGIAPPMGPERFGNAAGLFLQTDLDPEFVGRLRSNTIAQALSVRTPPLRAHDALGDALSVAYALQHLLREGRLRAEHFGTDPASTLSV